MKGSSQKAVSCAVLVGLFAAMGFAPATLATSVVGPPGPGEDLTVITADRLTYDAQAQHAVFEGNVVVNDTALKMTADHLTIHFGETNEVQQIVARGNVIMTQEAEDRRAWAQHAVYEVETGKIVLEGDPRVMSGRDLLAGERITFWRDDQRMICYPRARLIIYPEGAGARDAIRGGR